ncbi:Mediator complex subunit Med17 [Penicillium atrosanguineum]|uniref:Mediator of RNA polymerase II transcription subunit 17 n=1 Tax=Penicillium atrosanguineum TaxID=1132637 RepID=A0A9W9PL14_9EURO|nr:Mediator complex subunit Med17 [Penicillium atrosanguineum]
MADSFTLPLRPVVEQQNRPDTLPVEIAQINSQWGSFRDVNEEVLRAKIAEEEARDGALSEDGEGESSDVDTTERLEQLYKRRADITQFAMQSHMETTFALDFVSLLLSKHAPRQAETSMSAYLKQIAPVGSLHSEVVNPPPKPESASKDVSTVSRGWRTQNFNSAANKLLTASTRLEGEITSETRYWNEVLAIKENGWKVCRLPRERQALGVQYGFLEATPVFRDRGLASLRRAENGSLILDKGLIPSGSRFVRVHVKQGSNVFTSSNPTESTSPDVETIEQRILQARDSVFEEELFHELVREARSMASSGVTTRENLIRIPASDEMEIQLELVDSNDDSLQSDQNSPQRDSLLADGLAHSIRLLLAFAHRQNMHRRTQMPPPLTSKKRHTPEYHLLRPALAYLQHLSSVKWLESYFSDIFGVLRSSGLEPAEYISDTFSTWKQISLSPVAPRVEALVEKFLRPIQSVFRGQLLTPNGSFAVTIQTNLSGPPFGTFFDVSFDLPTVSDLKSPGRLGMRDEVESAITHLLLLDVVSNIASKELPAKKAESPEPTGSRKCKWDAVYPHLGELLLSSENPEKHKKMKVSLTRSGLGLSSYVVRSIDGVGRGAQERPSLHSQPSTWKSPSISASTPDNGSSMMNFIVAQASHDE